MKTIRTISMINITMKTISTISMINITIQNSSTSTATTTMPSIMSTIRMSILTSDTSYLMTVKITPVAVNFAQLCS